MVGVHALQLRISTLKRAVIISACNCNLLGIELLTEEIKLVNIPHSIELAKKVPLAHALGGELALLNFKALAAEIPVWGTSTVTIDLVYVDQVSVRGKVASLF
jgi:hypothetical protein